MTNKKKIKNLTYLAKLVPFKLQKAKVAACKWHDDKLAFAKSTFANEQPPKSCPAKLTFANEQFENYKW